jgi:hypothetical protein
MAKFDGLNRIKQVLIAGLVQIFPPKKGLEGLVFGTNTNETTFDVEQVLVDTYNGKRGMAGYTARGVKGQTLGLEGWETKSFKPPVIDEGFTVTARDLSVRSFGENQFATKTSLAKLKAIIKRNITRMLGRRQRAWNLQVAQLIQGGVITVVEQDDRGKNLPARKIDFDMPNTHKYNAPVKWSDPKADIFADFRKVDKLTAKASGLKTQWVILGDKALAGMFANTQIKELMDNRRIELGKLHKEELDNGLTDWGIFAGKKIYTFDDWYLDPTTGKDTPYIDENMALFGTSEAETDIVYGALYGMKDGMPTVYEAKQLVDVTSDKDTIAIENRIKSAKLYCLTQSGAFVAMTAVY